MILESPYAGDITGNVLYAQRCLLDSLWRDEAPIASHLLYPQVLDDMLPVRRKMGIDAGLAWLEVAEAHVFYIDKGWSDGMLKALEKSQNTRITIEIRSIYNSLPIKEFT